MAARTGVRRWVRRAVVGAVAVAGLGLAGAQPPTAKAPVAKPPAALPPLPTAGTVATLNTAGGTLAVSQEEFGKFLMDRGGAEKLELFVNKRIIELAAAEKGITVTAPEMKAALEKDMDGIAVKYDDFVKIVLPKYGKTLFEYMEDIVRPRLLLEKLSAGEVQVADADLKIQFERVHGEKRVIQMVLYPLSDAGNAAKLYAEARKGPNEFDSVARNQPNPGLAASLGKVKPISRHMQGDEKVIEEVAFKLKVGEMSEMLKTGQGYVFIKLLEVLPQKADVTFEKEKDRLKEAAYEQKLEQYIPVKFAALKQKAQPNLTYMAPKEWQTLSPGAPGIVPAGK
jgi:hypothetical protein